jgi:hypothetical protein
LQQKEKKTSYEWEVTRDKHYKQASIRNVETEDFNQWNKKTTTKGFHNRLNQSEEKKIELQYKSFVSQTKKKSHEERLQGVWYTIKHTNICNMEVLKEKKREKTLEIYLIKN